MLQNDRNCRRQLNRKFGTVYTPNVLADWVSLELFARLAHKKPLVILDPACGDGALLKSIAHAAASAPLTLVGVDVDNIAIAKAAQHLPSGTILKCANSLNPCRGSVAVEEQWRRLTDTTMIAGVISNPPWGADPQIPTAELRSAGFQLARGQFDSYDLFAELCLRIVPDGAFLALIIPDSLFFPEHKALRSLLLERTQLHLIARLGEGFFGDVYRGTAVVVCEKRLPRLSKSVECFRLRKKDRDEVLANRLSLADAKKKQVHRVPQQLFDSDPEKRFIIDVGRDDLAFFSRIHRHRSNWVNLLTSGRGVELSKTGAVLLCPRCGMARPEPRESAAVSCEGCGQVFSISQARRIQIIRKSTTVPRGWKALIVGEDVDRYSCESSRIIKAAVPGINYKQPAAFAGTKLLVRKTGVGLKAAIDDSGAFTNQVVFHYRPKPKAAPAFFLDYVLGVLCSRVMLAYHLKRTGESEWRSHPYVTQKTIAELPVPIVSEGQGLWRQARAIADAVSRRRNTRNTRCADVSADLHVDSLVAGLYGLDNRGCSWVLNVLNEAQPLQSITTMRADIGQLRPIKVHA